MGSVLGQNGVLKGYLSMSALGQKQTFRSAIGMSALPPKADIGDPSRKAITGYAAKNKSLTCRAHAT